jgi:hypothetical protein
MSTVKSKKLQVGTDASASNNFTIYQPATPDGTLRIGVGNADSPTEVAQFTSSGLVSGVSKLDTATGSAPSYSARAWVNFNGTGTVAIRESGNVSSITDNGTGDYTVNFTTAMADANYSAVIGWRVFSSVNIRAGGFNNYTTSSVDVYGGYRGGSNAFTAEDATYVSVAIFR